MDSGERERWQRDSWDWLLAAARLPSKAVSFTAQAAATEIFRGRCLLTGYAVQNTVTTAGGFNIYDGADANGQLVLPVLIASSSYLNEHLPRGGVQMDQGIYLSPSAAVLTGSVFLVPLWDYPFTPPGH
jgi:hypothetical protein